MQKSFVKDIWDGHNTPLNNSQNVLKVRYQKNVGWHCYDVITFSLHTPSLRYLMTNKILITCQRFKRIYFIKKSVWLKVWMIHTIPPFITDIDDSYRKSWSSGTSRNCFIICISIFGISFAVRISNILTQNYIVWSQRFDTF